MNLKYFEYLEFDSPDLEGSGYKFMDKDFLFKLDEAREIAGIPFKINSGHRTPEHNKKVGGVKNSSHLKGVAADIACSSDLARFKIITALLKVGITRIGIANGFIHCDIDPDKNQNRIWTY